MSDTAKLPRKERTPEQIAEEKRIREVHRQSPIREVPADTISGADAAQLLKFVAALRREREAVALSLEELAKRAGIDVQTLSRFESGQAFNLTISILYRLASALGKKLTLTMDEANH